MKSIFVSQEKGKMGGRETIYESREVLEARVLFWT